MERTFVSSLSEKFEHENSSTNILHFRFILVMKIGKALINDRKPSSKCWRLTGQKDGESKMEAY